MQTIIDAASFVLGIVGDTVTEFISKVCVWAGSDEYRQNMKDLGWGE